MTFLAVAAAFMLYVDWAYQPPPQPIVPPYNIASSVASAKDLASLKLACLPLAQNQDSYVNYVRWQSIMIDRQVNRVLWAIFMFCLSCGSMLLYAYLKLRRASKSAE